MLKKLSALLILVLMSSHMVYARCDTATFKNIRSDVPGLQSNLITDMEVYRQLPSENSPPVIKVFIDNRLITFSVQPQLINDRTMLPMRKIFETLGAVVEWKDETQLIIASKDELIITMKIGDETLSVTNLLTGETKYIVLDSVPVIVEDSTLVPVRAISETLGYKVEWDGETWSVMISSEN